MIDIFTQNNFVRTTGCNNVPTIGFSFLLISSIANMHPVQVHNRKLLTPEVA